MPRRRKSKVGDTSECLTISLNGRPRLLDSLLESLNLPAALEALDRPIGLPPSLLRKAEEVRLERGPERIEASIRDVQTLANHDSGLLDEVRS